MSRPLSMDLRQRVVAALARWESTRAVAARFGVAVSSVVKWSQRYRATGSVAPGKMGGHRKRRVTDVLAKAGLPPNWLNLRSPRTSS
jgi:transposase